MGASLLRTAFLFVFIIWVFVTPASAAVDVAASVDSPRIGLEDQVTYSIVIRGGGGSIRRPEPPRLDSFTIFSAGSSSSFSIVNGRMRSTAKFTYVMVPHATGTFTIPPVDIRIKGRTYRTDPVTVEVLDQGSYVRQAPAPAPPVVRPPAARQPRIEQRQPGHHQQHEGAAYQHPRGIAGIQNSRFTVGQSRQGTQSNGRETRCDTEPDPSDLKHSCLLICFEMVLLL